MEPALQAAPISKAIESRDSPAYRAGQTAYSDGKHEGQNPYRKSSRDAELWVDGWFRAYTDHEEDRDRVRGTSPYPIWG